MIFADMIMFAGFSFLIFIAGVILFTPQKDGKTEKNKRVTWEVLRKETDEMLSAYAGGIVNVSKRSKGFLTNAEKTNDSVNDAIRRCNSGNMGCREVVKSVIVSWLGFEKKLTADEKDILLDENDPAVCFEAAIYDEEKKTPGAGFGNLWKNASGGQCDFGEYAMQKGQSVLKAMSAEGKTELIGNMLYAATVGLGAVESLMWQKELVEEIQIGLSGIVNKGYDYREELRRITSRKNEKAVPMSRDSIHVVIGGRAEKLGFLTFGSEDEQIRVIRNLIRDSGMGELTGRNPRIVTETPDGRRITVSRPPFTDSWCACIRKFESVKLTELADIIPDENLRAVIEKITGEKRSIAITGATAAGKTTLLRALLLSAAKEKSLRVIESESFELNIRNYLPEANTLTLRVTEKDPYENVLAFTKKTTGSVFSVGEVNSPRMAVILMDMAKTSEQLFFTAHYRRTEDMIADFTNARLSDGNYTDERLAREEALRAICIDIHLENRNGARKIDFINEVTEDGKIICLWKLQEKAQ